ncbi:Timeless domain containing protein [Naviculisporaceae sp. PSN 640]
METQEINSDTVHPEVRAHINSLVSALGGFSVDDGCYKLGDDALEVLRDLKRWIRFYDEKTNRMDVARCLAEANIVGADLLQILATWPPNCNDSKYKSRIALACFEVMVPLTWPIEKDRDNMTVNHHRHIPVLQLAQLNYKRAIINFDAAPILNTAVRVALPSMAVPIGERTARDVGIIKLILFFLRNIALISPPPGIKYEGDEAQISRSATIDAFSYQDIFLTLLTIASNMGEDFRLEDVIVMEIIFHIVKRVDPSKLFVSEKALNKAKADELSAAMNEEAALLRSHNKNAPTRHSRFGTMIWVKRENGKLATVSGQDALLNAAARERKLDSTKTFKPPKRTRKEEMEPKNLGPPVSLDERARQQLRSFVEEFLDSGFNPLFQHVRKSLDREAIQVLHEHRSQFFYLVAWFLEAERMRKKAQPKQVADEVGSFNLVAAVLNQEMFITLNRALDRAYNDKDHQQLSTVMRCFTQILLTVQDMSESENEDNQEIADNILNRLFYEETTHDLIATIVRTYKDQGFEYLDACTELTHTFIRLLEAYSKQNVDMQVRSRKRVRRKKKAAKAAAAANGETDNAIEDDGDDSANDEQQAEKTSQERKFDFKKFTARFAAQQAVDTFVLFTKFYRDLNDAQLKRAHRFFHRVAFKQDMSVMLFRLDIIHLFYNMIKGPEPLNKNSSMFKEWEELTKHIIKKCVRKLEERPALFIELLFSKISATTHYLEYGHEKQTITSTPRPAAELEFKKAVDPDQQIAIVVGVLLDKSQTDHLQWIKKQITAAETERRAWESAETAMAAEKEAAAAATAPGTEGGEAATNADVAVNSIETTSPAEKPTPPLITVRPDNDARRTAMFKNPHLRLLMKLVGMERLAPSLDETPDSSWCFPGRVSADMLRDSLDAINKAEFDPPIFEDGQLAEDQLRRKSAAASRKRANRYDDDLEGINGFLEDDDDDGEDDGIMFPVGRLKARKLDGPRPKKRQRRRREPGSGEEEDEEEDDEKARARAKARRQKELEKARKIKSQMYVDAADDLTDDERDREFFEKEKQRQEAKDKSFGLIDKVTAKDKNGERTEWDMLLDVDGDVDGEEDAGGEKGKKTKKKQKARTKPVRRKRGDDDMDVDDDEDEDEGSGDDDSEEQASLTDSDSGGSSGGVSSSGKIKKNKAPAPVVKRRLEKRKVKVFAISSDEEEEDADGDQNMQDAADADGEAGEQNASTSPVVAEKVPEDDVNGDGNKENEKGGDEDEDEDADMVVKPRARAARPRARAGFIDSSDDE